MDAHSIGNLVGLLIDRGVFAKFLRVGAEERFLVFYIVFVKFNDKGSLLPRAWVYLD